MIQAHLFPDDGETPNNPVLPLVVMHADEAAASDDPAEWFEKTFVAHDWSATWRWGVYDYHHFHRTNHEVLGVARGTARLMLGGATGREFEVRLGDVVVIPAGVSHKCLEASEDFLVVGAYPRGEAPDLVKSSTLLSDRQRIAAVPLPAEDPLHGPDGPLFEHWKA